MSSCRRERGLTLPVPGRARAAQWKTVWSFGWPRAHTAQRHIVEVGLERKLSSSGTRAEPHADRVCRGTNGLARECFPDAMHLRMRTPLNRRCFRIGVLSSGVVANLGAVLERERIG